MSSERAGDIVAQMRERAIAVRQRLQKHFAGKDASCILTIAQTLRVPDADQEQIENQQATKSERRPSATSTQV